MDVPSRVPKSKGTQVPVLNPISSENCTMYSTNFVCITKRWKSKSDNKQGLFRYDLILA